MSLICYSTQHRCNLITRFFQVVHCEFLSEEGGSGELLNDDPNAEEGPELEALALASSTPLPSTSPPSSVASLPSIHREEAAADSEGAQRESELPRDTSTTKVDLSVLQEAMVGADGEKADKERSNASETVVGVGYVQNSVFFLFKVNRIELKTKIHVFW